MFEKIVKVIVAAEILGATVLGCYVYSEIRYHQGRADAFAEIGDKFRESLNATEEKHDSEKGEG